MYSCGGEPNIKIWDLNNFKQKGIIETGEKERMGRDIVFIEKYNIIVVGFQDGIIGLYDITDRTEVAIINTFNRVIISCILYLERENLLVAGTDLGGKIGTWKLKEQSESLYPEPEFIQEYKVGGTYTEKMLPVNNESQLLISTGSTSKVTWLNLKKGTQKTSPSTKLEDCVGYALDPYGRRLVLGDYKSNKLAVLKY
jgi:WD40 repeat protein